MYDTKFNMQKGLLMQILKSFIQNYPDYVKRMRECSYHYDGDNLNLHHLEGDVWSHTMISYSNAMRFGVSKYVKWALLLHDIGRVFTRSEDSKNSKVDFGDFEGVSCFIALEIFNSSDLSNQEKSRI